MSTPHDRAMDRCEAARAGLKEAQRRAAELVGAAEKEMGEALRELARYEKKPGIALPVDQQERAEAAWHTFMERHGGD